MCWSIGQPFAAFLHILNNVNYTYFVWAHFMEFTLEENNKTLEIYYYEQFKYQTCSCTETDFLLLIKYVLFPHNKINPH